MIVVLADLALRMSVTRLVASSASVCDGACWMAVPIPWEISLN
jgi:hypothetical protein